MNKQIKLFDCSWVLFQGQTPVDLKCIALDWLIIMFHDEDWNYGKIKTGVGKIKCV